jgi:pilus assembly protein FimV
VAASAAAATAAPVAPREPAAAAEPEFRDPVAEADILIAYGRVERALEVLRAALELSPERSDVRLKLMEMLAEGNQQEAFLAEYDQLVIDGDAETENAARELLVDRGLAHWLSEIDQPAGVQQYGDELHPVVAATPETAAESETLEQELARMDIEEGITDLDAGLELDLDADLARSEAEADTLDEELALEIGELDLDLGAGGAEQTPGEFDLELDQADLGELELSLEEPAAKAAEPDSGIGDIHAEPAVAPPVVEAPPAETSSAEDDADLGMLEGSDEVETKLELARAYVDMGDLDGARDILDEVVSEGSEAQREQANGLLERIRAG